MTPVPAPVTGVVLAAGAGTRLGRGPKALLPFHGRPLIEHILAQLHDGGCRTAAVVLGAEAERVRRSAALGGAVVVVNPDWESGMASSFRAGVDAAAVAAPDAGYLLVALGDQPGISAAVVARLLDARTPGRVTAAGYRNPGSVLDAGPGPLRRGHPMLFDLELARQAAATALGDQGARSFLAANGHLVDVVDCSDAGDGLDVDTPADLPLLERPS
ncbi:nucleotidyltransferase family protein [Arthrobacter sp. zg-ZUI100]|uniref:nucleotidyltransferase family protein n=1 Tax=Arthrobacter jiangjiafuii TaxID=2817475 RepID=UPI001AEE4419|nr:nucleotidyltransferase family protein [Arthrobacter jiangjiafuii]MBP3035114.1 nucleotidyltransferase family protein [Arthrobacter jiangjiafuii]